MPKKPDRFDRVAERVTNRYIGTYVDGPAHAKEIAKLLRAEHAWFQKQIEEIDRIKLSKNPDIPPHIQVGIASVLDDLECRLAQRRK